MTKRMTLSILLIVVALMLTACTLNPPPPMAAPVEDNTGTANSTTQGDTEMNQTPDYTGPVTEIAIRRLNEGQGVSEFAAARDAFVALLKEQPGVGTDREFASFLDFSTFTPPSPPVFIGMTEYETLGTFAAVWEALGTSLEAGTLFSTFTPEVFTALRPLNPDDRYDLAALADQPGQVLEIAARNLANYASFDTADYEAKRDAFLAALAQQDGFVAEYQWVSVLDPNIVVGMTVYESAEAFQTIATSEFARSEVGTAFAGTYAPIAGFISFDARTQAE